MHAGHAGSDVSCHSSDSLYCDPDTLTHYEFCADCVLIFIDVDRNPSEKWCFHLSLVFVRVVISFQPNFVVIFNEESPARCHAKIFLAKHWIEFHKLKTRLISVLIISKLNRMWVVFAAHLPIRGTIFTLASLSPCKHVWNIWAPCIILLICDDIFPL